MKYSVDIERSVDSLTYCLKKVNNEVENISDWRVSINAGGIDYGIYFNFDIDNMELEISNQSSHNDILDLDNIIEKINEIYGESEDDESK